ncbi:aldehyde dehydrogenase family protein [Desulfofundulus thermosubterraneus]|uniref:Propionaldehyde dehydrogenase n=1 Tax=Desulfofundulus thermosubterraneus DSM 16057 TaxID=1121432 RepID=A0A1M6DWS2_9FIRM|nr:aldehyde dehydrogenase family protein [Desulfofundulus thermosubterraneus]SHI77642.1 propionaldehyde dehydrogenase [Desulfofundulus thermosubterraneus DSM 16057]
MQVAQAEIYAIVEKILEKLNQQEEGVQGAFSSLDEAVEAARRAQEKLALMDLARREELIRAMREAALANVRLLAEMAVQETGRGRVEDKIMKNTLAAQKTPGTEDLKPTAYTGDYGLTLVEMAPVGIIGAITPVTNPAATIINNSIGMIAAGNAVVFSPHPSAEKTSLKTIEILHEAIIRAGGPSGLVVGLSEPSVEKAGQLMHHPGINMLVVTGGSGVVKAALSSGKKAIGAGAGNPPVLVDHTADIERAARDIVMGASFDNNMPCVCEKVLIVVDEVADDLIRRMQREGAFLVRGREADALTRLAFQEDGNGHTVLNRDLVGKDASYILEQIGVNMGRDTRLVIMETDPDHPFVTHEQMMPVLPVVRVRDVEEGIQLAVRVEGNNRHTAIMHSKHIDYMTEFARAVKTTIFVKNAPCYAGIGAGGEGYCTFTIAGPTGEGLTSARSFTRQRRCVLVDGFRII